ncbi:hypothetical protein F4810DRAFT_672840 [Camillea tinctor]|nr:hypothetical protein F4810DRAFT_672840 [Camillea tinctor]
MPRDSNYSTDEPRPSWLSRFGAFIREIPGSIVPTSGLSEKKKQSEKHSFDGPTEQALWNELSGSYPHEFVRRLEQLRARSDPYAQSQDTVYLVLHGVASEADSEATETNVVGVLTSALAANTRVLSFTRAVVQDLYNLDRVPNIEVAADKFWWSTSWDELAATQFLDPEGEGHNVYAVAVKTQQCGFSGDVNVVCPSKRCWSS